MANTPRIPPELKTRPFSLEDARNAGLTLSALRGSAWRRLGAEIYCWSGLREDPLKVLSAWQNHLPRGAVFAGETAGWLWGLDLRPTDPIEILAPPGSGLRCRDGLSVRRCDFSDSDVASVRGLRATGLHRTLSDLCLRLSAVEALVAIDMAVFMGLTEIDALVRHAKAMRGRPGAKRLRSLVDLAAPAESPMETRLRWLLIRAGLPRPEMQTDLFNPDGRFVGRADLYYPRQRLVLEYDGDNHRERLVADDRRQNLLIGAGFRLLRFTAGDIHRRPDVVVAQVRGLLGAAL